jgi:hypothetical protein
MPNLAATLKDEIRRLAKKEIKAQTDSTKQAVAQYRRDIANLCENMLAFWSSGKFLGDKENMDDIANAIVKVHENRDELNAV